MLRIFENKSAAVVPVKPIPTSPAPSQAVTTVEDLRRRVAQARNQETELAKEAEQSRTSPAEKALGQHRALVAKLSLELREAEAAETSRYQADLSARYDSARCALAEALCAASRANDLVESIEREAFAAFPRGQRPSAPACFYQHSTSWQLLSVAQRGRIVSWLHDLHRESPSAYPSAAAELLAQLDATEAASWQLAQDRAKQFTREHDSRVRAYRAKHQPSRPPLVTDRDGVPIQDESRWVAPTLAR